MVAVHTLRNRCVRNVFDASPYRSETGRAPPRTAYISTGECMQGKQNALLTWLGVILLVAGFLGHFFAARAIGGTYIAYRDHIFGFVALTLISAAIVALLGMRFWKGRHDITLLIVGVIQTLIGIFVYVNRFSVHG